MHYPDQLVGLQSKEDTRLDYTKFRARCVDATKNFLLIEFMIIWDELPAMALLSTPSLSLYI
jgi:hypothetical protein